MEPVRIVRSYVKLSGLNEGDPYVFIECVPTIYPVKGKATSVTPGQTIEFEVPDMYGRPWAQMWEKYSETGDGKTEGRGHLQFWKGEVA